MWFFLRFFEWEIFRVVGISSGFECRCWCSCLCLGLLVGASQDCRSI